MDPFNTTEEIRKFLSSASRVYDLSVDLATYPGTFSLFPGSCFSFTFSIDRVVRVYGINVEKIAIAFDNGDVLYVNCIKNGISYTVADRSLPNLLRRVVLAGSYFCYKFTY